MIIVYINEPSNFVFKIKISLTCPCHMYIDIWYFDICVLLACSRIEPMLLNIHSRIMYAHLVFTIVGNACLTLPCLRMYRKTLVKNRRYLFEIVVGSVEFSWCCPDLAEAYILDGELQFAGSADDLYSLSLDEMGQAFARCKRRQKYLSYSISI